MELPGAIAGDPLSRHGVAVPQSRLPDALDNVDTPAHRRLGAAPRPAHPRPGSGRQPPQRQEHQGPDNNNAPPRRDDADAEELANKLDGTLEYSSELNANPTERELDIATTIIAVGAPSSRSSKTPSNRSAKNSTQPGIAFSRYRADNQVLWKAFNPGSETKAVNSTSSATPLPRTAGPDSCR